MMHHAGYVFKDPCTGWNSFTASGTGSFSAISAEVGGSVCAQENLFGGPLKRMEWYMHLVLIDHLWGRRCQ